jgi:hypothetical protein
MKKGPFQSPAPNLAPLAKSLEPPPLIKDIIDTPRLIAELSSTSEALHNAMEAIRVPY